MEGFLNHILKNPIWIEIENWPISWEIGGTAWFPMIESIHVVAISLLLGTVLMVDLRLIGVAARRYSLAQLSKELLPWTWTSFWVAVLTGVAMFITRAASHIVNPAFQIKMLLLILAGANMLLLHRLFLTAPDKLKQFHAPTNEMKISGTLSLGLWIGITLSGRWIGHII